MSLLEVTDLNGGYGKITVVRGINISLEAGRVLAIVGPNGAGKTTMLNTISGLLPPQSGTVQVGGEVLPAGDPTAASRKGVVLVPDDRALFFTLTTGQNIELARRKGAPAAKTMLELFPALERRWSVKAGSLSGGEQQMLAMARALIQRPKVLLVDEMSMGLAPIIIESLLPIVRRIVEDGQSSVVLVEQHVQLGLSVADEVMVLSHGAAILHADAREVEKNPALLEEAYLGVQAK